MRLCALEKCKSEELLTSIIINDFWDDFIISEYAIDNINDKSILNQKLKEGDIYSQKILLPKIKDKSLLADIAYNHEDNEIREIALNSLMGTAEKDPEDELDIKIKMYIDILEENLDYRFLDQMIFFSHIEDNCIYLKLRAYDDPLYIDSLDKQDLSWDSHKVNDFESKFRPLDFKYDVWIDIEYEKYN